MTQSFEIPDGISSDALKEYIESAVSEDELKDTQENDTERFFLNSELTERAIDIIDNSIDGLSGSQAILVHKMMLHLLAQRMLEFHSKCGVMQIEDDETVLAISWLRDAGKFQAILNILATISCSEDDPTCSVA